MVSDNNHLFKLGETPTHEYYFIQGKTNVYEIIFHKQKNIYTCSCKNIRNVDCKHIKNLKGYKLEISKRHNS